MDSSLDVFLCIHLQTRCSRIYCRASVKKRVLPVSSLRCNVETQTDRVITTIESHVKAVSL